MSNDRCHEKWTGREDMRGNGYLGVGASGFGGHHFPTIHDSTLSNSKLLRVRGEVTGRARPADRENVS